MAANSASLILSQIAAQFLESGFGSFAPAAGFPINLTYPGVNLQYTGGNGAGQFNNIYAASLSVTNGTPLLLDLNGGTLKNPDQSVIAATDILGLVVVHKSVAGNLTLGGGSNDISTIWGASGTEIILPGGFSAKGCSLATGFVVTPSTAHILQIVASAGTINFDIAIIGH